MTDRAPPGLFRFRGAPRARRSGWKFFVRVHHEDGTPGWRGPAITCPLGHQLRTSDSLLAGADTLVCHQKLNAVELRRFPQRQRQHFATHICGAQLLLLALPGLAAEKRFFLADVSQEEIDEMTALHYDVEQMIDRLGLMFPDTAPQQEPAA